MGALARLLKAAGFDGLKPFIPVPSYHYPFHYVSLSSASESIRDIESMDRPRVDELIAKGPVKITAEQLVKKLRRRSRYGVLKLLSIDIVYIAFRQAD